MLGNQVKSTRVFNCPGCGAALEVTALGYTTTIICKSCKSILDATHPLYEKVGLFNQAVKYEPIFEIGSFGTLKGVKWKIIGFMVRRDRTYDFSWHEYLLYNPYKGFRWLLCIDGHFSLTSRLRGIPNLTGQGLEVNELHYDNQKYDLFNKGKAYVEYVVGEFYWRVEQGESVEMRDFISPPFMISEELGSGELNWSISEYVDKKEVMSAFKTAENAPYVGSVHNGANQPNPYVMDKRFKTIFAFSMAAIFIIALVSSVMYPSKVVKTDVASKSEIPYSKTFDSFVIPDSIGSLDVKVQSPVNNQWVDADITLVNEDTGAEFSFSQGVEYYSGYDSDGSWSEGSQVAEKTISGVPGGTYHMEADVSGDMPAPYANITIVRHGSMMMNFFIAFMLLAIPAAWIAFRKRSFEINRWSQSDYNPYLTASDYEDED